MQSDSNQHPTIDSDHPVLDPARSSKPQNKGLRFVLWIILLAVFAGAFILVLRSHNEAPKTAGRRGAGSSSVTLTSATAKKGDIGVFIDAIGTVTPVYTSSITSQVNGVITDVHYREGQFVHKGDALIDIDSRPYRATLLQAQGVLDRDQAILSQAEMDLARYQAAWARNAIQKQQLDDQEKVVEQDKGTVKNDQGVVQYDQVQVGFCHIVSPITGRVGLRLIDPGNVVQANGTTALAVITQIQPITVVFTVAEDTLGQIESGIRKHSKLSVQALDRTGQNELASGTLLTLDNQIDTTTGTVKARAIFPNEDSSLFPNQFVNTRLKVNTLTGVTLIPTAAIQHDGQAAFVYVLQDKKAHLRPITVGVTDGATAQVTGVSPGDVLATSSFDKLQDNTPITISTRGSQSDNIGSKAP